MPGYTLYRCSYGCTTNCKPTTVTYTVSCYTLYRCSYGCTTNCKPTTVTHKLCLATCCIAVVMSTTNRLGLLQQCSFNLNFRHRMAQYAGRASVGLHTQASLTLLSTSILFRHHMAQYAGRASVGLHTQASLTLLSTSFTAWRSTRDAPLLACTLRQV